jgi:hypothetical protein
MSLRFALLMLAAAALAPVGCRPAEPTGPGVEVQVRVEPKQGYNPPPPNDAGYGASVEGAAAGAAHDHAYHLIDYRRLEGIVVWLEPANAANATAPQAPPPLNVAVDLSGSQPARPEDVYVCSVGGRITFDPITGDPSGYVIRTEGGQFMDVPPRGEPLTAAKPGLIEVLSDGEEPVARVYVAPTSWARRVTGNARVNFSPVPAGGYVARAWHPILPGGSQPVQVGDGLAKITLTVGVNSLPKPSR